MTFILYIARSGGDVNKKGEGTHCDAYTNRHASIIECSAGHNFSQKHYKTEPL